MKVQIEQKHRAVAHIVVRTFCLCLLIGIAVWRLPELLSVCRRILSVFAPIIWGLVLAYLFSPMQVWVEKRLQKLIGRKKPHPRLCRAISVATVVLVLLLAIFGLIASIVPELFSSIKSLLVNLPDYMINIGNWMEARIAGMKEEQPQLHSILTSAWDGLQNSMNNFTDRFEPKLDSIASGGVDFLSTVTSSAMTIVGAMTDFLLGLIIAIYLLYNKERYLGQARKFLYAMLPEERVHTFLRIGSHVSYTFMHFLSGKTLDSLIIGLLCFTGMTILKMPYVTLISILIGVTNIIPFFGPFIGAVPSALLILLSEPGKAIPFAIFILVLQQFDGNILGPKILGDTLGLPMFWILFAIVVGGGLFGFIGMVAFIPLFAAVYALFSDFLEEKLQKKGLPADVDSYMTTELHYSKSNEPVSDIAAEQPQDSDASAADMPENDTEQPSAQSDIAEEAPDTDAPV